MPKLIGSQQKAYSRERNIGSILLNLVNMMDYVNKKKMEWRLPKLCPVTHFCSIVFFHVGVPILQLVIVVSPTSVLFSYSLHWSVQCHSEEYSPETIQLQGGSKRTLHFDFVNIPAS